MKRLLTAMAVLMALMALMPAGCSNKKKEIAPPRAAGKTAGKTGEDIVRTARSLVGVSYKYGGQSPKEGFDCSGFVQWVYGQNGFKVPRTSQEQRSFGVLVQREDMAPGDVMVFNIGTRDNPNYHSAIYIDAGVFVHSPSRGGMVREDRLDSPYWGGTFLRARRYLP